VSPDTFGQFAHTPPDLGNEVLNGAPFEFHLNYRSRTLLCVFFKDPGQNPLELNGSDRLLAEHQLIHAEAVTPQRYG